MKTIEELLRLGLIQHAQHHTGNFNEVIPCFYVLKKSTGNFMPGQMMFATTPYSEEEILNEEWQKMMFASHWEGWS